MRIAIFITLFLITSFSLGIDENLFISKYLLKLPSKDEMECWLHKELKELR